MKAQEIELKFAISGAGVAGLSDHPALAAPAKSSRQRTVYFDTSAYALKKARLSLRVRESEGGLVQTLKRAGPGAPMIRTEWETPVANGAPDRAALAATPAGKVLNGDALAPVFTTLVERTQSLWTGDGATVEVSLDRGEITSGDRRQPIQELELELKAGEPAALFGLASALMERADLRLSFQSKAARGYRLAADEMHVPQRAERVELSASAPAADALRDIGWSCLAQVATNAELLRGGHGLKALHQTRVGLRRLRATFSLFRPMAPAGELEAETRWLGRALNPARNLDVLIQDAFRPLLPESQDRAAFAKLGTRLLEARTRAYDQALAAVNSGRFDRLLLETAAWLEIGDWKRPDDAALQALVDSPSERFGRERLDNFRRRVIKAGRGLEALDAPSRHRLRIKAKKMRYAAEFFAPCFGHEKRRRRFLKTLATLQDVLGRLNDMTVAHGLAAEVAGQDADAAFAAGLLVGAREAGAKQDKKAALASFADFERAEPFWR